MAKKPRVKVTRKGDFIEIKTLISHKMETGLRKDKKGKKIPRMIINKFVCSFNGKEIMRADLHPAVAANPYFAFYAKDASSGTFDFAWTDDKGNTVTASADIKA